jgi:hypothetical protein
LKFDLKELLRCVENSLELYNTYSFFSVCNIDGFKYEEGRNSINERPELTMDISELNT